MSRPRISVVIPVHNGERYLAAAIDSALAQRPFEVIVADDGSTDSSVGVAQSYGPPVHALPHQPRTGIAATRNRGVAACSGEFVAFLDADDLWTADAVAGPLAAFAADSGLQLVFGHVEQFISPDLDEASAKGLRFLRSLQPGYLAGAVLIRRDALVRVGPFREDLVTGDFLDWMARARDLGLRETLVPEHVLWRRIHGANHGLLRADARSDYARVLKSALDRRRAAAARRSS
jgi:glycosyltransferase involved in cell wall biosynthesis